MRFSPIMSLRFKGCQIEQPLLTLLVAGAIILDSMHRFLVEQISGSNAVLTDTGQLHHIRDVLRLKINDEVILFDNKGHEYKAAITGIDKKQIKFRVGQLGALRTSHIGLTVACAIPKSSHMDDIIDSLTQLGVERIIPMRTERVVVKLDDVKAETRVKRWEKVAQNAARQCQRSSIPAIEPVTDFSVVVSNSQQFALKLIPHLVGERQSLKDVFNIIRPKSVIVLIGPEGDFTSSEVELALHKGFVPISLGDTVLRVATAAVAVASYIRFVLNKE
jgi:16S rRNA (uracil1498-N3)-methyltransferase